MSRKIRGSSLNHGIEMTGVSELLKKIEAAGGKAEEAAKKAADATLEIIGEEMKRIMSQYSPGESGTGDTYRSFKLIPAQLGSIKIGKETYNVESGLTGFVGFEDLTAIFLDVFDGGTPKSKPHFWRYYAVNNTLDACRDAQQKALNDFLKELK